MWIVYRKKDRKVVGMSALAELDLEKPAALAEVVRGLVDHASHDKYDALQVLDSHEARALISAPLGHVVIADGPRGRLLATVESPRTFSLRLSCDAQDVHPVDGIPEIAADGAAFTTITVQKVDDLGEPQRARNDNDELHLRTTAGTLLGADGKEAVTSVRLKQGQAALRLQSEKARRVATVTAFNADAHLQDGSIRVEFI